MKPQGEETSESSRAGRIAAVGAVVVALVVAGWVMLGGDDPYTVHARFQSASNIVKGNYVQVAGRKVGTIQEIDITDDGFAEIEMTIEDEDLVPLRSGTRATFRMASLSGEANRFVDLRIPSAGGRPIPNGGTIDVSDTTSAVEVDQLFSMFDERTRKGLRRFIRGQAVQWGNDQGPLANDGWEYVNPSVVAARRLFRELNYDTQVLREFVVNSSRLVTDVADRRDDVSALVDNLADMTGAIAREEQALSSAIGQLPPFMRRANSTFVDLRATLDDLAPVVEESKPVTPKLRAVLGQLRPFAREAVPTVRGLSQLVRRRGEDNDLLELAKAVPPLRDIAVGPVQRNGKERPGALETSARSLKGQAPHLAYFRPYTVDFTGWLDDFSHSGIYDANGSASRVATSVNAFAAVGAQLKVVPPELRDELNNLVVSRGQNNRCPGASERPAADGSNPWKPTPNFPCDLSHVPPGQ